MMKPEETKELELNIKARKEAEDLLVLLDGQSERFWLALRDLINKRFPKAESSSKIEKPMSEEEVKKFEKGVMPYGAHAGFSFGEIPTEYLVFIAEGNDLTKEIRRYVKTKRFKQRQDQEDREN